MALSEVVLGLCIHSMRGIAAEIPLPIEPEATRVLPQSTAFYLTAQILALESGPQVSSSHSHCVITSSAAERLQERHVRHCDGVVEQ